MKSDADEIIKRYDTLDSEKAVFKAHWQEVAEYMIPRKASITTQSTPGGKRTTKVYDGTAIRALRILANGLYGHMTSPSAPWFEVTVRDAGLKMIPGVKEWLREVSQRMQQAIQASNFHMVSHELYTDLGAFGTAPIFIDKGQKTFLNFTSVPVGQVCIAEDHAGRVDTVLRLIEMTLRQCIQRFGNRVDDKVAREAETHPDKRIEVIHAAFPRDEREEGKKDGKNKPIASVYVDKESRTIMEEGGYNQMPYCVPRWEKDTGEVFGRSPGMDALPDTKMLNLMKKDYVRAFQKMIDPPLLVSDENKMRSMSTKAASIIYYRSNGQKPESLQMGGNYQIAVDYEQRIAEAIRESFYADLFMLLAQKPDNVMTATEVLERVEEKLILLGPTMGRLQQELYDPMLTRCFWILFEEKALPQVPKALMGTSLQIEYISRLALAMRKYETDAMGKTMGLVGPIAQIDQTVLDNFDFDAMARGGAERFGLPTEWMRAPDKVRIIRESRAKQQAAMMAQQQKEKEAMMQADIASKALPPMSQDVGDKSVLAKLMASGQMPGGQMQ